MDCHPARETPHHMTKLLVSFLFACCASGAPGNPLVFPVPQEMEPRDERFRLEEPVRVLLPSAPSANNLLLARELAAELSDRYGLNVTMDKAARVPDSGNFILMGAITNPLVKQYIAQQGLTVTRTNPGSEGYILDVRSHVVLVAGSDERGAFYGLQSLRQLIAKDEGGV